LNRTVPCEQTDGTTIRETTFADYNQISALHMRNGLTVRRYDDWIAYWKGNPIYERLKRRWPIGWVLETGGKIVGSIGSIPLAYHFRGSELLAAAPCSWLWILTSAAIPC